MTERELEQITMDEMIAEIQREWEVRRTYYQKRINEGSIDPRLADRRVDVMRAVLTYLRRRRDKQIEKARRSPAGLP